MSIGGYKIRNQRGIHFLTFQVIDWMDVFTRKQYKDIFIEALQYCQTEKELRVHAYVIMSNHVHLMVRSGTGQLSDTIRDLKRHTSKTIIKSIKKMHESRRNWMLTQMRKQANRHLRNELYQLWTHENHPISIKSNRFRNQRLNYTHNNPVKAGIVDIPEHYLYSSARNYVGLSGLMHVDLFEF